MPRRQRRYDAADRLRGWFAAGAEISADELAAHDRLRAESGLAQWLRLDPAGQAALITWINTPRRARARRARLDEAVYALNRAGEQALVGHGPELDVADTIVGGVDNVLRYWLG